MLLEHDTHTGVVDCSVVSFLALVCAGCSCVGFLMSLFRVDEACNGWTLDESEKASNRDAVKSDAEVRRR